MVCSRFLEEGGHLDPVWIYQEVPGIVSSIVHTCNPCWHLRFSLVGLPPGMTGLRACHVSGSVWT
jgi:hypothetical protein